MSGGPVPTPGKGESVDLSRVEWQPVLDVLRSGWQRSPSPRQALRLAEMDSLSALFCDDYPEAVRRLGEALTLDPLNPLHRLRAALCALGFGAFAEVARALDGLDPASAAAPRTLYLRALTALRQGELKRAANIATELIEQAADFAPARFLLAEANLRQRLKGKGLDQILSKLPRDPAWAAAWATLLAIVFLINPTEGGKLVEQAFSGSGMLSGARQALAKEGREELLLRRLLSLGKVEPAGMIEALRDIPAGSRLEELALAVFYARLTQPEAGLLGLRELRRLYECSPERGSLRRLYAAALTRQTVEAAGREEYRVALRLVEMCLRLEPHETIHYQNRAALHTLMRDPVAYHESWAALERHHYRLALLGDLTPRRAQIVAKIHRMFAQQGRLTALGADGIFRLERSGEKGDSEPVLSVNQAKIDADPDLLRQWLFHRQAELLFGHVALGSDAERALLLPSDRLTLQARAAGLKRLGGALSILVPGEGEQLAVKLERRWKQLGKRTSLAYAAPLVEDEELREQSDQHISTCGDLALLCFEWQPGAGSEAVVDELIRFLDAEAPFLAGDVLFSPSRAGKKKEEEEAQPSAVGLLAGFARKLLKLEERNPPPLQLAQARRITQALAASLLRELAVVVWNERKEGEPRSGEHALRVLDRARELCPTDERVEFLAAHLLLLSDFYQESRQALARFFRLSPPDHPLRAKAEEMQRQLDELKEKKSAGYQRIADLNESVAAPSGDGRVSAIEEELSRFPSSIQTYVELVHALAQEGQFETALLWSERAIARCLSRQGQLRARALDLETAALKLLATTNGQAVRLYLAGSRGATLAALPGDERRPYPLDYLAGQCLLADRRPREAQVAFGQALAKCTRQLHRAVLRPLAEDVEQSYVEETRRAIDALLGDRRFGEAFAAVRDLLGQLSRPERALLDLSRVQLAAVVAALGSESEPQALPELTLSVSWQAELAAIASQPSGLERARRLAELSVRLYPAEHGEAEAVLRKVDVLAARLRLSHVLANSGRLLQAGDLAAALAALDALSAADRGEVRVRRQRALILLRLERFIEADEDAAQLAKSFDPVAKEFSARYPELRFRQAMALAGQRLRSGDAEAARSLLAPLLPTTDTQKVERAYHLACCAALFGYKQRQAGERDNARVSLREALELVEQHLAVARRCDFRLLIELQDQLEKDLSTVEGQT